MLKKDEEEGEYLVSVLLEVGEELGTAVTICFKQSVLAHAGELNWKDRSKSMLEKAMLLAYEQFKLQKKSLL